MRPKPPRRPFVDLQSAEVEPGAPSRSRLFLGRLDEGALRQELAAAGILSALAERGYPDVVIRTGQESGEHQLRILPAEGGPFLVDLRLAEASTVMKEPGLWRIGLELLSLLSMHWLALQDPRAAFRPERPRLPGQDHPGLGLARRFYECLLRWAEEWGKDGLLAFPHYLHNAVFYAKAFRFVSPSRQGRFEALWRDLGALPVAAASAAVDGGRVLEEAPGGTRPLAWEPGEMVAPLTRDIRGYLDSAEYRRIVERTRDGARFRIAPAGS